MSLSQRSLAMASSTLILLFLAAAAALAVLAAGESCEPGSAFPHDPLQGCRAYVMRRCAGDDPPGVRARCCQQLGEVAPPCRCDALQAMVEILVEEEAAPPECRKGSMAGIAATLPARHECDLEAPPAPIGGACPLQSSEQS
ncbi:hypothetical protein ACP70R_022774 [Stipagrostis hirtigluma subsp. patula]